MYTPFLISLLPHYKSIVDVQMWGDLQKGGIYLFFFILAQFIDKTSIRLQLCCNTLWILKINILMGFNIEFVLYDQCISKHISTLQYDLCLLFKLLTRTPVTIALGGKCFNVCIQEVGVILNLFTFHCLYENSEQIYLIECPVFVFNNFQ